MNTFKNKREQILGEKIKLIADTPFPISSEWEPRLARSQRHFIGLAPGIKVTSASYAKAYGISVSGARKELRLLSETGWVSVSSAGRRYVYTKIK